MAQASEAYHHGDLRRALLSAALSAVEDQGADAISLAALARATGVSQAAPYRHFPDREALLIAVAAEGFEALSAALAEAEAAGSKAGSLLRMCHAYVNFGLERAGLYRLMFASRVLASVSADEELKTVAKASFGQLAAAAGTERRALKIWVGLHGAVMLASLNLGSGPGSAPCSMGDLIADILT